MPYCVPSQLKTPPQCGRINPPKRNSGQRCGSMLRSSCSCAYGPRLEEPPGERMLSPSLTILCFHIEAESQVPITVQQPSVTGCCHIQHQPALVPSLERLKIQKQQVRLPVDTKQQLTEGRGLHSCFVSLAPLGALQWAHPPALGQAYEPLCIMLTAVPMLPKQRCIFGTKCCCTHVHTGKLRLRTSMPSLAPQPGQQGRD